MVSDAIESSCGGILQSGGEQTAEDTLNGRAPVIVFFEKLRAIRDTVAWIIGETPKVVTAFLLGKLGVVDGTDRSAWVWARRKRDSGIGRR